MGFARLPGQGGAALVSVLVAMAATAPQPARAGVRTAKDPRPTDADNSPPPGVYGAEGQQETETLPPPEPATRAATDSVPATHTVKPGDTLWGISRTYFHDPYRWPKIWALNPEIVNPHWIFPGQALQLHDTRAVRQVVAVARREATGDSESTPGAGATPRRPATGSSTSEGQSQGQSPTEPSELRQIGFVDEGDLKAAGVINGSVEEKILLGTGDHAYVEFPADKQPKGGAVFTVYQADVDHPIREPRSNNVLGYLVHVYGDVVIDSTTDRPIANARLLDLVAPVERGYLVGPQIKRLRAVRPKHNQADMTARVVASVDPNMLIANQMFVVLNRGSRHGVEMGNRFLVLRQGDGIKRVMEEWDANDHRFPPHAVAEIVAIGVQNETTIGWISRGTRELHVGDMADMRRGY